MVGFLIVKSFPIVLPHSIALRLTFLEGGALHTPRRFSIY